MEAPSISFSRMIRSMGEDGQRISRSNNWRRARHANLIVLRPGDANEWWKLGRSIASYITNRLHWC